jgi:hypothetical protein
MARDVAPAAVLAPRSTLRYPRASVEKLAALAKESRGNGKGKGRVTRRNTEDEDGPVIARFACEDSNTPPALRAYSQDHFERAVQLLRQYARREGHPRVPNGMRIGGFGLGAWMALPRHRCRTGHLSEERVRALEGVRGWTWSPRLGRPRKQG